MRETSVLFVCLGNICRSPLAEGIFLAQLKRLDFESRFHVDSCGTGGWHAGEPPHAGSIAIARKRGIDLSKQRSRKLVQDDFSAADWIIAMDASNESDLRDAAPKGFPPTRIARLLDFAPDTPQQDVPDPYYEGGFERVFDLIETGCSGLLGHLIDESEASAPQD